MATCFRIVLVSSMLLVLGCGGTWMRPQQSYYADRRCPSDAVAVCDVDSLIGCRCGIVLER